MDPSVIAAMARWPDVPDCRGWLSLDRRGRWRLQGSPVAHAGLAEFIGRNYACDASEHRGTWFMQNGPQRVWVELEATPWIFRFDGTGFTTHTGLTSGRIDGAWLVDNESLCLSGECGFGQVDDRDLQALLERIRRPDGSLPDGELKDETELIFDWNDTRLPLRRCADADLPAIGGFRRSP